MAFSRWKLCWLRILSLNSKDSNCDICFGHKGFQKVINYVNSHFTLRKSTRKSNCFSNSQRISSIKNVANKNRLTFLTFTKIAVGEHINLDTTNSYFTFQIHDYKARKGPAGKVLLWQTQFLKLIWRDSFISRLLLSKSPILENVVLHILLHSCRIWIKSNSSGSFDTFSD